MSFHPKTWEGKKAVGLSSVQWRDKERSLYHPLNVSEDLVDILAMAHSDRARPNKYIAWYEVLLTSQGQRTKDRKPIGES